MLLRRFADHATGLRDAALPPDVVHAARRATVDWLAATLPGVAEPPTTLYAAALADEIGRGPATLLDGRRAPLRTAALLNGIASHTTEFDDIYAPAIYHPGSPTIAAALPAGQATGASGEAFLRAVVAGYEISTRIGRALGRAHYRHWHNTGTVGSFGAATAAGLLLGLDAPRLAHALATVATMAAGLQQAFRGDSQSKPLHAGHAAETGVLAVLAAREGVVGALDILDAPGGLGAAMGDSPDWGAATADLGTAWNILRTTVKNHGCCGHAFAAIDGALALQSEHRFAARDVAAIRVGGYSATVEVTGNMACDTPAAAKFSLPFLVASALVNGSVRLDACTPARLGDPAVRALMARIGVHLDPEVDALFPGQRAARLEIELGDGRTLQRFQPHRVGDPDLPLSDAQLEAKYRELATPVLGPAEAERLLAAVWMLDRQPNLDFVCRRDRGPQTARVAE